MLSWPASVRVVCPPLLLVPLLFGHEGPMWVVPSSPAGMCTQLSSRCVASGLQYYGGCTLVTWVSVCLCILGGVDAASHPHYQVYLLTDTHIQNTTRLFVCASMFFFLLFPFRRCLFSVCVFSYRCSSWRHTEFFNLCSVLLLSVFHRDFLPTVAQREL